MEKIWEEKRFRKLGIKKPYSGVTNWVTLKKSEPTFTQNNYLNSLLDSKLSIPQHAEDIVRWTNAGEPVLSQAIVVDNSQIVNLQEVNPGIFPQWISQKDAANCLYFHVSSLISILKVIPKNIFQPNPRLSVPVLPLVHEGLGHLLDLLENALLHKGHLIAT